MGDDEATRGRAVIAAPYLSGKAIGGGEHEALCVAEALRDIGFKVSLICGAEPDFRELRRQLGIDNPVSEIFTIRHETPKVIPRLFRKLSTPLCIPNVKSRLYMNLDVDRRPFLIPLSTLLDDEIPVIYYFINAAINPLWRTKLGGRGDLRRFYRVILAKAVSEVVKRIRRNGLLIAICGYTARKVEAACGMRPEVLYGAIEAQVYRWHGEEKEEFMVASGRLVPYKRFEFAIRAAKRLGRKLIILGAVRDREYYEALLRMIRAEGVEELVKILTNLPIEERADILKRAKVFLHCSVEAFGKAVAESMAAGCIPVVPKEGGQSEYTLREFHYSSFEEMLQRIEEAFTAPATLSRELSEKAMEFDKPRYKSRFIELLRDKGLI